MDKKIIDIKIDDADSFAMNTEPALVFMEIKKAQIVEGNIASALERLHILADSDRNTRLYKNALVLIVEGYDDDRRELVEIEEVRAFFKRLNHEWPHWLWFLNQDMGSIGLIFALLCEVNVSRGANGYFTEFTKDGEMADVLEDMLDRGSALFTAYNIEHAEIDTMMNQIMKSLFP